MHAFEYTPFYGHSSRANLQQIKLSHNWNNYYNIVSLLLHKCTTYIIVLILQQKVDPSLQVDVKMSAYHQVWRIKQRMAAEQEWKRRQMENVYRFVSCRFIRQSQNRFLALIGWIENDTLTLIGLRIISQLSLVEGGFKLLKCYNEKKCKARRKTFGMQENNIQRFWNTSLWLTAAEWSIALA